MMNQEMMNTTKKKWFRIKYKKWAITKLLNNLHRKRQQNQPMKPIRLLSRQIKVFKLYRIRMLLWKICINFPKLSPTERPPKKLLKKRKKNSLSCKKYPKRKTKRDRSSCLNRPSLKGIRNNRNNWLLTLPRRKC